MYVNSELTPIFYQVSTTPSANHATTCSANWIQDKYIQKDSSACPVEPMPIAPHHRTTKPAPTIIKQCRLVSVANQNPVYFSCSTVEHVSRLS